MIRGSNTNFDEIGLYFTTHQDAWLKVVLMGNAIEQVKTKEFIDNHVIIKP